MRGSVTGAARQASCATEETQMCGRQGPGRLSPTTVLALLTLMVLAVGLLVTGADAG